MRKPYSSWDNAGLALLDKWRTNSLEIESEYAAFGGECLFKGTVQIVGVSDDGISLSPRDSHFSKIQGFFVGFIDLNDARFVDIQAANLNTPLEGLVIELPEFDRWTFSSKTEA